MWQALLTGDPSKSSRTDVYYGITDSSVGRYGPALRTADGAKLILGGWGGDRGEYKHLNNTYVPGTLHPHNGTVLFNVQADPGESVVLHDEALLQKLKALISDHQRTGVPQATPNASCTKAKTSVDPATNRSYWGPWC